MPRVYLAAQYHRKNEIAAFVAQLRGLGIDVVSTWTDEPYNPAVQLAELTESALCELAERDIREILRADTVVMFSVGDQEATRRNGRMVEFGIGLAADKRMIVCGPRENLFHYLSDVEVYPDWATTIRALEPAFPF
jgi:nucleoside 2-deoxyribosyltransferase